MRIKIKNANLQLNDKEVKLANNLVNKFLMQMKETGDKLGLPTFYFTLLIVMHVQSEEQLCELDTEKLAEIMLKLSRKKPTTQ